MKYVVPLLLLLLFFVVPSDRVDAQTYYYDGGKISAHDLRRARTYKKGTYALQGARNRGIIWIPKYDARGNRWLEMVMEHFLQGSQEIRDYTPIQVGTIVGGSHGIASVLALLMDVEAREMLEISEDQGEKINDLFTDFRRQVHGRMQEMQRNRPQASPLQIALVRTSEIERLSMVLEPRLETILTPQQMQRSKEFVFQLYGGFHTPVVDLGILSLFNLSREQRERLERVAEDANEKRDRVFAARESGSHDAADMQAFHTSMGEVAAVVGRKIREALTPAQIQKGDELMAEAETVKAQLKLTKK